MSELWILEPRAEEPRHVALDRARRTGAARRRAAGARQPPGARPARVGVCSRATASRPVCPTARAMIEVYLAAAQAGWYLTPINHHLTAAEIALHPRRTATRRRSSAPSASPRRAAAPPSRPACRRRRAIAAGEVAGFRSLRRAAATGSPTTLPDDRAAGQVMNYTSGTTGRPKGVRRALAPYDPDTVFSMFAMFLGMFGIQPEDDNVHLRRLAALPHRRARVRRLLAALRPHRRADGQVDAGELPRAIERYRVTTSHMVPTQFHRLLALPEEREGARTTSRRCAT